MQVEIFHCSILRPESLAERMVESRKRCSDNQRQRQMAETDDNFPFNVPAPGSSLPKAERNLGMKPDLAITRLIAGGMLWGMDLVMNRLLAFEVERFEAAGLSDPIQTGKDPSDPGEETPTQALPQYEYSEGFQKARYALVGILFLTRDQVVEAAMRLDTLQQSAGRRLRRVTRPLSDNLMVRPVTRRYEGLVARGERILDRWIQVGQREAETSYQVFDHALHGSVDDSIEYLAENPEVKELVQMQSTGLADEAIEEIRERSVSADNFVEGLLRHLLRKMPRQEIPPPPEEVRMRAERLHPERAKRP